MSAADRLEKLADDAVEFNRQLVVSDYEIALLRATAELVRSLTPIGFLTGEKYCQLCVCSLEPDSEGHEDDCLLKKLEDIAQEVAK